MEDETKYFQQHEILRKKQFKQDSGVSNTIIEKQIYDQKGNLKLNKKHRFPFKITCFESVGKKIILGSKEGSLYAYQVLQTEQKQDFKLLYIEQNAHKNSQVNQIIYCNQNKRNGNNSFKQDQIEHLMNGQIKNLEKIDRNSNKIEEEIYISQVDNQTQNSFPNTTIRLNQNTNQFLGSIVTCGLYDRKIILWQMSNKFEKKVESQVFKTYINYIVTDDNFVYAATYKKIYALSIDTLTICMKFGIPNYKSLDFLISSVACISLKNSNILIAGTNCYNRNNYFISLWEFSKQDNLNLEQSNCDQNLITHQLNSQNFNANQMNLEADELNFDIDNGYQYEEQKINTNLVESQSINNQQQQIPKILNDIEDLDNFDIDGDFLDTSTNDQSQQTQTKNQQKQSKRISFWQPTLLEFCHNSSIKQLKYNSKHQQLISVSQTEVNIWKISDEASQHQYQQINYQTGLTQNIAEVNFNENQYKNSTNISQTKMSQNQLETFTQKSKVIQVFSLQLNNERNVNAVVEKNTNNILLFLDNDVLSFDSSNYKLNFQSNIPSSNHEVSHLYLNPATQQHSIYPVIQNLNYDDISQAQPLHSHSNNYLLIQNTQSQNQDNQTKPKFIIAAREIEQFRNQSKQKYQISHSIGEQNKIAQSSQLDRNFQENQEKNHEMGCEQTNFEDEKEMNSPSEQAHQITQCQKKLIQSPISAPPTQKNSTAHIVPSTASYTVLMNQLKKIEHNNIIQRQLNISSQLRRSSNSTANQPAVQLRKPQTCQIRSNSKCIKKQLKRHIKYSNKKKKQNLVKVFQHQNSQCQNILQKQINSQSLTLIEEKSPPINNHQQRDFQIKQQQHNGNLHNQKQIHINPQKQKIDNNKNNILNNKINNQNNTDNILNTLNKVNANSNQNNVNNNTHQKTFLITLDSELSLGFYTIS